MPRGRPKKELTISQLQSMLEDRKRRKAQLLKERKKVEGRLAQLDREIAMVDGDGTTTTTMASLTGRTRPRNKANLPDTIYAILEKSNKPMSVGDIADAVKSRGYQSSSANFRGIVNQTLIKDDRFVAAERGYYKAK